MDINIGKANVTLHVDVDMVAPHVMEYIVRYGLTQILNDAHSAITATAEPDHDKRAEAALALAQKKLDAMMAGDIRSQSTGRIGDPVKAEAIRLATIVVKNAIRATPGKKLGDYDAKALRVAADKYLAKHPELIDAARVNVETAKELAEGVEI